MAHFSIASRASSRTLSALAVLAMAAIPTGAVANPTTPAPTVSATTTVATTPSATPSATALNTEAYQVTGTVVPNGNYQSVANAKGEVFIGASVGRPPIKESTLVKGHYDASGKFVIDKQITPAAAADGKGVNGVYGVAVDDANGYVWVSNTRQNTVAVYKQSDLSLVKQYPANAVTHARAIRVIGDSVYVTEAARGKGGGIKVFNAKQLDAAPTTIDLPEGAVPMDFDLDSASGRLFTVDLKLNKAYVIDTKNSNQVTSYDLPGANGASGVTYDPANNRLFVASQSSNNAVVLDLGTGKVIADIPTGSQSLGAVYSNGYVYVGNRTAGTVSVINASSLKVEAILPTGTNPNHLSVNPDGSVNVVDKAASNNQIFRIARKGATPTPTTPTPAGRGLTAEVFRRLIGNRITLARAQQLLPGVLQCLRDCGCDTVLRRAMWFAQTGHESDEFTTAREYASGDAYDTRTDLGNTPQVDGDGARYKGRGWIQLTGAGHYRELSRWANGLGLVPTPTWFFDRPELLEQDAGAFLATRFYWTVSRPQLNALADRSDLVGATRAVNGGTTGLDDRREIYARALAAGTDMLDPAPSNPFEELLMSTELIQSTSHFRRDNAKNVTPLQILQGTNAMVHEAQNIDAAYRGEAWAIQELAVQAEGKSPGAKDPDGAWWVARCKYHLGVLYAANKDLVTNALGKAV